MAVFCEIDEVLNQIRYKTQIFYESLKRDSIAEQLYNFSNDDATNDQSIPYSKSLEKDYSSLIYVVNKTPNNSGNHSPVSITLSPPTQNNNNNNNNNNTSSNNPSQVSSNATSSNAAVKSNPTATSSNQSQNQQQQQQQQPQQPQQQQEPNKPQCKIVTFSASQSSKPRDIKNLNNNNNNSNNINNNTNGNNANTTNNTNGNNQQQAQQPSTNEPVFLFVKEQVKTQATTQNQSDSLLTKLVRPNDTEKDLFSEYGEVIPPPGMGMLLSVHTGITGAGMLKVRVIDKATVIQTIAATLKTYFSQQQQQQQQQPATLSTSGGSSNSSLGSGVSLLYPDPKAYFLRIADDEGRIDEDYPTLDPNQMIYKFKEEIFVLCLNQKYEAERRRASWGVQPGRTLSPNDSKGHVRRVSVGTSDSILVVKITLPDSSITKVAYQPDMKLRDLLINTCKKRKLNVAEHQFQLENGSIVDLKMTLEQLGTLDIILVSTLRRSMSGDGSILMSDDTSSVDDEIFWYDALAWQYKTYEVVKYKKYGSKQERILGVDKERITNMLPNLKKEQETKRPTRLIKDVSKVALLDKPKQFTLEYADGKAYIYEAKSQHLAVEIVGKIQYLLKSA